ncbi:2-hydroxy-6-oxo-2,4-heptadienoate hydrolase [Pseudomonas alkylphenolica]|uniref:2-hydroxy-6-oxo-2,4-heptadienoate hydrolase n=1 Tax=Pseudomonas alkylphenolica TaxID=237609 RepID=A0A443ZVP8_9PSED|nr:alpha/beta hydrolase [Pseudomonas alkylphenolica]RWU24212.1 2-hydroxy-6-oxo-2,4-heptadienoate hydrolase [Pseudomonas alkylphenolica]
MNSPHNPEIGQRIQTGSLVTNYHDIGSGEPVLLLHGSGPGVSAWANWRLSIQGLKDDFRLLAPDLAGFGFTETPTDIVYSREGWLEQLVAFLDALDVQKVNVIGNSFGGSMALALAIHHPQRVNKLILMGSVGVPFELTPGLDAVWSYEPSHENMRAIMRIFAYDQQLVGDDLVRMRYEASKRPGVQEAYAAMFPAPRQRWVEAMAHGEAEIRSIAHPTLLVHGRDDKVIPLATSLTLQQWIDDSQLHIFGRCGHWTQIEHAAAFGQLVTNFLKA